MNGVNGPVLVRWIPCDHSRGIRFSAATEAEAYCRDMNAAGEGIHHFLDADAEPKESK